MTGGSNGIGREICLELARCGCSIACLDLDLDAAKQLCMKLRQLGVKANAYKVLDLYCFMSSLGIFTEIDFIFVDF